jgi:DNA sulfur modification protein DndD
MKLIKAHIKNFRLLKDLVLDFSVDPDRPLTVIRAANETGKTTCETALIWGLYGSSALAGKGQNYPLYPSDSLSAGVEKVDISVEIEFETTEVVNPGRPSERIEEHRYRLLRTCIERPTPALGEFKRTNEHARLFEVTEKGVDPIPEERVEGIIENSIPIALKDVYFTDGDSAMSFIEAAATQGVKRQRVRDAIEALLGLEYLEKTIKHLNNVAKKFSQEIDNTDYASELEQLNDAIEGFEEDLAEWRAEHRDLEGDLREGQKRLEETERRIEEILQLGDRQKLLRDIQQCKANITRNEEAGARALSQLAGLLRTKEVAASVIGDAAQKGLGILEELSRNKQLPKVNIPILEELLDRSACFCGESLDSETASGRDRRSHIADSIEKSREADALSEAASSLFYSVRSQQFGSVAAESWLDKYQDFSRDYADRSADARRFEADLKRLDSEVSEIEDSNLEELRQNRAALKNKIEHITMRIGTLTANISETEDKRSDRVIVRDRVEKKLHKTGVSTAKLDASRLCANVFEKVYSRMRGEEVERVSEEMNRIFMQMIGARPEENDLTLITKAELTDEFDIKVFGPQGHELNPDTDLNGASRRAITLAFILALTRVSRVEAPNVIDTPLGMMSGYVKQAVLMRTLEEGSQVILFLTHDEIKGVEPILDAKAGRVFTLTNPAHYPNMLVNKPPVSDARIIRCECSHRTVCDVCERRDAVMAEV